MDGGLYRTVYAGDSLRACLIELATPLRPDPALVAAMEDITGEDHHAPGPPHGGGAGRSRWTTGSSTTRAASAELDGRFLCRDGFGHDR